MGKDEKGIVFWLLPQDGKFSWLRVTGVVAVPSEFLLVFVGVTVTVEVIVEADICNLPFSPFCVHLQRWFDLMVFV
ncbi:hypothetical protein HRbin17_02053 [bacterium HR17]|jgi:hypothetical protein|uniref:Uncharacterized protein n=1 Tax=Candidatus Fervidibacter japonicus TaxID=2035412 RepID=A0A2H5XEB1_9BACT|nr:hypothetical protein HRbin17_02053 [bacterium HR17]